MQLQDVIQTPGFEVLEHTPGSTKLKVPSGFTLTIRRVGPYTFDDLDEDPRYADPGPMTIVVKLLEKLQPPGIEQEIMYEPPTDMDGNLEVPDREEHERGWMYFQQWRIHERKRSQILVDRNQARNDRAMMIGITIDDGPTSLANDTWLEALDADPAVITDWDRRLLFLKTQVITTKYTADAIRFFIQVQEVTIEGLKSAFDSFRSKMGWDTSVQPV